MEHYQAIKVTFACNLVFDNYPFDSHECDFDFGMPSQVQNKTAILNPLEILMPGLSKNKNTLLL